MQQLLTLKVTSCRPEVTSSAILDDFDGHQDGRGGGGDANSSQERVERQGLMLGMTVGGKEEGGGGNPSGKPSKWNQCTFQCALCLKTSNRCCHRKQHCYGFILMYIFISLFHTPTFQPGFNCHPHSRRAWVDFPRIQSQTPRPRDSLTMAALQTL